jgi:transcriptional regulator with XRE-family HTH domain
VEIVKRTTNIQKATPLGQNDVQKASFLSVCQIIGLNLRRIRRSRGLTQEAAARQLEPYLGYRLTRAAFSQAEHCKSGKLRRFDADEIVAFARAFEVPIAEFFVPPESPSPGKPLTINGKPGNPRARVTAPPLTGPQLLRLVQAAAGQSVITRASGVLSVRPHRTILDQNGCRRRMTLMPRKRNDEKDHRHNQLCLATPERTPTRPAGLCRAVAPVGVSEEKNGSATYWLPGPPASA